MIGQVRLLQQLGSKQLHTRGKLKKMRQFFSMPRHLEWLYYHLFVSFSSNGQLLQTKLFSKPIAHFSSIVNPQSCLNPWLFRRIWLLQFCGMGDSHYFHSYTWRYHFFLSVSFVLNFAHWTLILVQVPNLWIFA